MIYPVAVRERAIELYLKVCGVHHHRGSDHSDYERVDIRPEGNWPDPPAERGGIDSDRGYEPDEDNRS